jgi:hypothetical protein
MRLRAIAWLRLSRGQQCRELAATVLGVLRVRGSSSLGR